MPDTGQQQTNPIDSDVTQLGEVGIAEITTPETVVAPTSAARLMTPPSPAQQRQNRAGNAEHLAVRRPVTPLDVDAPEVKQRLSELRTEVTTLVTNLRWAGASVEETTEHLIPLLNVGSVQQWAQPLVATILEIDRAGNLIPVWLKIIEQDDAVDLPPNANPAETMIGCARRFALLMLGNYKAPELSEALGKLAVDPNSSLYATQSLAKQGTTSAMRALVSALKDAEGWAKVDIVEACVTLKPARFDELLLASGLDRAAGLESYIAVPLFRSIELERYLRGKDDAAPRLSQQAAMVVSQVLQDSLSNKSGTLPIIFERDLPPLATALFEGVRSAPDWRNVIALHRLGLLLARYWPDVARGVVQDSRIVEAISACVPMMPNVERWMSGAGRDVLLEALGGSEEEAFAPCVKALGDLREPRIASVLITRLDAMTQIADREQALQLADMCETLGRLGDGRVIDSLRELVGRAVNIPLRGARSKRRDNLPVGDADIPASIVYAAVVRAFGQFGDHNALDFTLRAANDFDPYVRTQAFEALRRLDPHGEDVRSRMAVREALDDPRDGVVHIACQLVAQYHDSDAVSALHRLAETRPECAASARDALRQLGQMVM